VGASRGEAVSAGLSRISAVTIAAIVATAAMTLRISRRAIKGFDLLRLPGMADEVFCP
jgi:predicted nuclease with TOPRIM domain